MKHRCYGLPMLVIVLWLTFGQTTEKGLDGVWQGTLDTGGTKLRIVLTITRTSTGGYSGNLESLDQGAMIPVDAITVNGDAVKLEVKAVGGAYEGKLNKDRSELVGTWTQGGSSLPLTFKAAASASVATPDPKPASTPAERPFTVNLDITAPAPPTAFHAGGRMHLVYELHVTNFNQKDCLLTRVEVLGVGEKVLASYEGNELAALLSRPGAPSSTEKPRIGSGLRAIVYLWVTLEPTEAVPPRLRHRLSAKVGDFPEELKADVPGIAVNMNPIEIGSPLRGG